MFEILLKEYIDDKLSVDIQPSFGTGTLPIFTYIHTPTKGGYINESQYEVRIIDNDMDKALALRDQFIRLLDTKADSSAAKYKELYFTSSLAGGGQLFNDSIQVWELSLIFIIKWRIRNG